MSSMRWWCCGSLMSEFLALRSLLQPGEDDKTPSIGVDTSAMRWRALHAQCSYLEQSCLQSSRQGGHAIRGASSLRAEPPFLAMALAGCMAK